MTLLAVPIQWRSIQRARIAREIEMEVPTARQIVEREWWKLELILSIG